MALRGLSNKETLGRLVVSVRTVEGHLNRAYAKLGVAGRSDLGHALGEDRGPYRPRGGETSP